MSSFIRRSGGSGPSIQTQRISADQTLEVNKRYILTGGSSPLVLTLPATASVGDVIIVDAQAAVNWSIIQQAGQQIICNGDATSVGSGNGLNSGAVRNSITLVCSETDLKYVVESQIGTATIYAAPVLFSNAHYLCNDNASDAVVTDALGNHPATLSNYNTDQISGAGKINEGFVLNGNDNDEIIGTDQSFAFNWATQSFTMACWVNAADNLQDRTALHFGSAPAQLMTFYTNGSGHAGDYVFYFGGPGGGIASAYAPGEYNAWVHLVGVWDHITRHMRFYKNGVLVDEVDASASGAIGPEATCNIWLGNQGGGSNTLEGILDDARFSAFAWTQTEVDFVYNSGNGTEAELVAPIVSDTLIHYKMNDNTANAIVLDAIGTLNGTFARNTSLVSVAGKINNALSFNGSSDDIHSQSMYVDFTKSWSFSFWHFQPTDTLGNVGTLLMFGNQGGTFVIFYNNIDGGTASACESPANVGDLCMAYQPTLPAIACSPVQNAWSHIVGVVDVENNELRLYLNDVLIKSSPFTPNSPSASSRLIIGSQDGNTFTVGNIDDLRVINRALFQADVDFLWNSGAGTEAELT